MSATSGTYLYRAAYSEMNLMLTFLNLVLLYVEKCTIPFFVLNYRDLKALKEKY